MRSASSSSTSSQSSNVSWHPSHEANFQTASFGLRLVTSDLPGHEETFDAAIRKYRTILANEFWSKLAMAAESDRAFHIALHRQKNAFGRNAARLEVPHGKAHHDLGAAQHCDCVC